MAETKGYYGFGYDWVWIIIILFFFLFFCNGYGPYYKNY
jgi:hypothetical protein